MSINGGVFQKEDAEVSLITKSEKLSDEDVISSCTCGALQLTAPPFLNQQFCRLPISSRDWRISVIIMNVWGLFWLPSLTLPDIRVKHHSSYWRHIRVPTGYRNKSYGLLIYLILFFNIIRVYMCQQVAWTQGCSSMMCCRQNHSHKPERPFVATLKRGCIRYKFHCN